MVKRLTNPAVAAVAIERGDGSPVEALHNAGLRVVMITRGRSPGCGRAAGSGATSDTGDAYLLADLPRTDGHRPTARTQDRRRSALCWAVER